VSIIKKIGNFIKSLLSKTWNAFDIRDIFVFGGVGMLGYGLKLTWSLGVALIVCGTIMFILGLLWPVFLSLTAKRAK